MIGGAVDEGISPAGTEPTFAAEGSKTMSALRIASVSSTSNIGPTSVASAEEQLRKLRLDHQDLEFECSRLKASLERAQHEILALTESGTMLRHKLDRIHRLVPRGSRRLLTAISSWFRRR